VSRRGYSDTVQRSAGVHERGAAMPHGADQLPFAMAGAIATAVGVVVTTLLSAVVLAAQRAHATTHSTTGGEQRRRGRRVWVRERPAAWWDTTAQEFDDAEFRSNFRMCWETFYFVADMLRPQIQRQDTRWREALGFQKVTAIALYRLATGADARDDAWHCFLQTLVTLQLQGPTSAPSPTFSAVISQWRKSAQCACAVL
jgi:hypothetical protein